MLFSENHNQLHRFAAICSFLDCVQCVFNVAFTVCSLYVQCQLPPETYPYKRPPCSPDTQHTFTLRTDLAYSLHTYPFAQVREAWSRAVSGCVGCECGLRAENKKKCFSESTLSKVLSLQKLQRQSCKGGIQNTACYASHAFLHRPHTFYDRYHALAMS